MMEPMVNRLQANVIDLRPDLFPLFWEAAGQIEETDCEVTRDIGYATVNTILEDAVNIVPRDIENVLHRLGCAHSLLDAVSDRACRGLEIDGAIEKIANLLSGIAIGLAEAYEIDMRDTRLDFYLPGAPRAAH